MSLLSIPQMPKELEQREEIRFKIGLLINASGVVPEKKSLLVIATV